MRRLSLLFALLLIFPAFNLDKVKSAVRPLQLDGQTICTATSINSDKSYWLTAAHCVADDSPRTIEGKMAFVTELSPETDLAVLTVPGLKVRSLKMQHRPARQGQKVYIYGYPIAYDGDLLQGTISNPAGLTPPVYWRDPLVMRLDMTACGGNSGSSIVNEKDEVVSVLLGGHGRPCDGFSIGATWNDMLKVTWRYFKK